MPARAGLTDRVRMAIGRLGARRPPRLAEAGSHARQLRRRAPGTPGPGGGDRGRRPRPRGHGRRADLRSAPGPGPQPGPGAPGPHDRGAEGRGAGRRWGSSGPWPLPFTYELWPRRARRSSPRASCAAPWERPWWSWDPTSASAGTGRGSLETLAAPGSQAGLRGGGRAAGPARGRSHQQHAGPRSPGGRRRGGGRGPAGPPVLRGRNAWCAATGAGGSARDPDGQPGARATSTLPGARGLRVLVSRGPEAGPAMAAGGEHRQRPTFGEEGRDDPGGPPAGLRGRPLRRGRCGWSSQSRLRDERRFAGRRRAGATDPATTYAAARRVLEKA